MLYNVLPPLIFFASLGGIILVVSRVVLRLRRDQVAAELQSHISRVSKMRLNKVQDLAGILAPKQISVQNFKNRLTYLAHTLKETSVKTTAGIKDWRKHKLNKKQARVIQRAAKPVQTPKHEDVINPDTPQNLDAPGIKPPASRLKDSLHLFAVRSKTISSKGRGLVKHYSAETLDNLKKIRARSKARSTQPSAEMPSSAASSPELPAEHKQAPVLRMIKTDKAESENTALPATARVSKPTDGGKSKNIGKLFRKDKSMSVLEQAKQALAATQIQAVEDILVPHLIKHPKDAAAYMLLGKAALSRKNWLEATEIFEQVLRIAPETDGCYAALGEAAYQAGNLTRAIEALRKAHDRNPQDVNIINCLIKIAARMDNRPMYQSLTLELKSLEQDKVREDQAVSTK